MNSPRCRGHRADRPLGHAAIEQAARIVRKRLAPSILATQALPGIKLFDTLDEHTVPVGGRHVGMDYEVGELPGSVAGEARYCRKSDTFIVKLATAAYMALRCDDPRARFSLAHEIGHVYLHARQLIRMSRIPHSEAALQRANAPPYPVYWDTEWQADSFAAALLMPAEALEEFFTHRPSRLMAHHIRASFNVSTTAAKIRWDNFLKRRDELLGR